jgi:hypothetical protein
LEDRRIHTHLEYSFAAAVRLDATALSGRAQQARAAAATHVPDRLFLREFNKARERV